MIVRLIVAPALIVALAACGKSGDTSNTADDVDAASDASGEGAVGPRTLAEGTAVCLQAVAGQRYPIEEALAEASLEVVDSCIRADALIKEEGQAGAFVLRYQLMGDAEWKECTSSAEARLDFLDECTSKLVTDLDSGAGSSSASAESGVDE